MGEPAMIDHESTEGRSQRKNKPGNGAGARKKAAAPALKSSKPKLSANATAGGVTAAKLAEESMRLLDPSASARAAELDRRLLLAALTALKKGDFSMRLPIDLEGVDGKIADAFNDVVELNER